MAIAKEIREAGINKDVSVSQRSTYFIDADVLSRSEAEDIAARILIDPITEDFSVSEGIFSERPHDDEIIIAYNPGVFDTTAASLCRAVADIGFHVKGICSARYYKLAGLTVQEIAWVASRLLYNPLIEHILDYDTYHSLQNLDSFKGRKYVFRRVEVDISTADNDELVRISREGNLSLTLEEMAALKAYFSSLGRNPTDCELETIAQTWSEHCAHKTFRGTIHYEEHEPEGRVVVKETIYDLLKTTIIKATREINALDCVSVFDDNSGVVRFNADYNVCYKVETHNHPSSLEPYGGAATGIGGVIRDILGTGCAARPVASTDVFCFADWHMPYGEVPRGLLHPRKIMRGVYRGVRDYGNRMGIPTIAGAVFFDPRFLGNPLVYCGTVGILPKDKSFNEVESDDLIIVCGARTGRDGIHGATFSSVELSEGTLELTSAVQIGNPIEEKKMVEAVIRSRDKNLFNAITDCGAGGLSSAIGEMTKKLGAEVWLDKVPLKYSGLTYSEIWISESQERMVMFTKKDNLEALREIFDEEEVEMTVIGKVNTDKKLRLLYDNQEVAALDMDFLHAVPRVAKKAVWVRRRERDEKIPETDVCADDLRKLLAMPNISPKDWIIREYDHEVQGGSVIKPLTGIGGDGVSDAAVIRPDLNSKKCIALGMGINPFYSDGDPYWMAALAIDEALRNVVCVGGNPDRTFILDNFSWGSPNDESLLAGLVRASKACYDFATHYGVPFISGKDSLYNEYVVDQHRIAIPGTLLISALSIIEDYAHVMVNCFQEAGNLIYLVGNTSAHLGCSHYFKLKNIQGGLIPQVDRQHSRSIFKAVSSAIAKGLVVSCHDCAEGGLAVALAEMCLGRMKGANIFLEEIPCSEKLLTYEKLFSESPSRFILEVRPDQKDAFEAAAKAIPLGLIGCVGTADDCTVWGTGEKQIINIPLAQLRASWSDTFQEFRYQQDRR